MATSERINRLDADLSSQIGVSVPALRAIRSVESGGNPRAVRFETRVFRNRTGQTVEGHDRAAFQRAYAINPTEAVNSTSWGWFQVMGFHGFPEMYGGAAAAVRAFDEDPEAVGLALFKRWMSKPAARTAKAAAARLDFATFASIYNGCAMPCERYATRMQAAYDRAVREWRGYVPSGTPLFGTILLGVVAGAGFYFYKRKKKTGSFFGLQDDVDDLHDEIDYAINDSFWWTSPSRPHGGEDGPRDRRKGYAKVEHDRSGGRAIVIVDDLDCKALNNSIIRLKNAKNKLDRLIASHEPEDFDAITVADHESYGRKPFDPEYMENYEFDLIERMEELRAVSRANGCQQIEGLRR